METVVSDRTKGLPPVFERKVVHRRQRFYWDCGVSCVLMVLPSDGYQHFLANFNEICKEEDFNKSTWTIDLCYLLKRYNVKHLFCTVTMGVHPDYKGQAFYEKVIKNDEERVKRRFAEAVECGIGIKLTSLTYSDLIEHIFKFGPVILLTNASLLSCINCKCRKFTNELLSCLPWPTAYAGHYIVLIGYNLLKQLFYYRNPTYKDLAPHYSSAQGRRLRSLECGCWPAVVTMWPLLAVAAACAFAALWLSRGPLGRWRRLLALSASLPGPPLPLLSLNADTLETACRRYGTPCRLWVGCRLYVLLSDPAHARAVLAGCPPAPAFHQRDSPQAEALRPFSGQGLATATSEHGWRLRRRLVEKTLTPQWVQSQLGWLRTVAARLVSALHQQASGTDQRRQVEGAAVERELSASTLDALCGCLLGQQARATGRPQAGFPHHYLLAAQLLSQQASRWARAMPCPLLALGLTACGEARSRLVRQLHGYIDATIDSAVHSSTRDQESHIALSWERAAEAGDDPDRLPGSALEVLLDLTEAERVDDPQQRRLVREELASLLLHGQPAARAALRSTLHMLALHPQVQTEACGDPKLLRRCVLESVRLAPPLPLLGRHLCSDVTLPAAGAHAQEKELVLPAGCTAVVCASLTHRDPNHWADPDAFQPDRFLEESSKKRHPFAFLSFGGDGGARCCPGNELALEQVCSTLAALLAAFRVVTDASPEDLRLEQLRMREPGQVAPLRLVPRA